jgi:hypothetical protein
MKFSEQLRERVRKQIAPCPTCGHRDIASVRQIAVESGIANSQLAGFMRGDRTLGRISIDKLVAWLDEHPEPHRFTLPSWYQAQVPLSNDARQGRAQAPAGGYGGMGYATPGIGERVVGTTTHRPASTTEGSTN